ncbi:hypothetical protein ILUMI_07180 [Ignelater luminosus]|uniref:Peptidase S1 domain-containing protein n=1 Tax=Ignelater luminosus TaxID=2038154 RepID=A0A8K0GIA8_IGNLU|nr:hypothetical protein ILUMI_07180 [Ignelater luminosus]
MEIVVGTNNIKDGEATAQAKKMKEYRLHPRYDAYTLQNDECFVILSDSIDLGAVGVNVVRLYGGLDSLEGEEATVLGWGRPSDMSSTITDILRHATDKIISNDECKGFFNSVVESTVCLNGYNGRSACVGDSGGPLMVEGKQVGVASFGSSWGCALGFPSAYQRVLDMADWDDLK